jgi:hypothetical protein
VPAAQKTAIEIFIGRSKNRPKKNCPVGAKPETTTSRPVVPLLLQVFKPGGGQFVNKVG